MTVEQRLDQLEKRNKRLTVALTMTVVAMAAVVTMAATGEKNGEFNELTARHIWVENDAGQIVVGLGATSVGDGLVLTMSAKGKDLVMLTATQGGNGAVTTYQPNGKKLVEMGSNTDGGMTYVYNKTGEVSAEMGADHYGNGVVGAYNRKGIGRTLESGP